MTEETKGMIMIASTMPDVSMPMPSGAPVNNAPTTGIGPSQSISTGWT